MRRHLALLVHYFVQYSKVRLAHRGDFLTSLVITTTAAAVGLAVVHLIFGRLPRLANWTFPQIVFLYGFSLLPLALFNTISINLYHFSEQYLIQGRFDRVLLRPVHSLFQVMFEQFRLEAIGDALLGIAILMLSGVSLAWGDWVFLAFAALCGAALYTSVFLMLTTVSFWVEDRVGLVPPVYNLLAFGRYPMDIYHGAVRFLLSWIVPFGFATFYPSASRLRQDLYGFYAWLILPMTVLFVGLALALWGRGVRNYSSTGS